jgi:S-adenosylmethionine/arginine decarboxylase-like enzyme
MANVIDGLHVIADGHVPSRRIEEAFSKTGLTTLMLDLVKVLDMQLIFGPLFKKVKVEPKKLTGDVFQDEGGISGICMIGTSHISVHVWPLRQHFSMDVFSCKTFDEAKAKKTIEKFFQADTITWKSVKRHQGGKKPRKKASSAPRKASGGASLTLN